jgi:hypothetical protein
VQLSGSTDAGNDALREAIDDLRRQLEDSGFSNATLDLRQGTPQQQQQDPAQQQFAFQNRGGNAYSDATENPEAEPEPLEPVRPTGNSRLDTRA